MPNKPTTLRDVLEKELEFLIVSNANHREILDLFLSRFNSHNKDLLSKIEGMKKEEGESGDKQWFYNRALDDIINLITQEKL